MMHVVVDKFGREKKSGGRWDNFEKRRKIKS